MTGKLYWILNIEGGQSVSLVSDQEKTFSSLGADPNPIVLDQTIINWQLVQMLYCKEGFWPNFCTNLAMNGSVAKKLVRVLQSCKATQEFIN